MSTNGVIEKALALEEYGPAGLRTLLAAFNQVLLGLCVNDVERTVIAAQLSWEERPDVTLLIATLRRRVKAEDDREILLMANGFRVLLPSRPAVRISAALQERTDAAADKVRVADVNRGNALEHLVLARQALARAKPDSDASERKRAELRDAEQNYADAAAAHERALAALARVLAERDAYARRAMLAESTR
jgi:hypothetical protein